MRTQHTRIEPVLGPDFARRVVERARKVKRRRRMRRWTIATALPCAILAALALWPRNAIAPPSAVVAKAGAVRYASIESAGDFASASRPDGQSIGQPLAYFFPGATTVADLQTSEASYWHWYDPWWNPDL